MLVFDIENKKNHLEKTLFFDESVSVARYESQKYSFLEKITEKQIGFFWQPQEVDLTKDAKDFKLLSDHEKHIFTSNLKRQILLDSIQGRSPSLAFLPICSLPELEVWIQTWSFFETIHSRSYTHIIRNVYSNPSEIFDEMMGIKEIVDCAKESSKCYDELIKENTLLNFSKKEPTQYHKALLYMALVSVNVLEGLRFYTSFACSWAFAELKKMEGNAKIIKLIARDENLHLASTQQLLKILQTDDSDFVEIAEKSKDLCVEMYSEAAEQEKNWAKYLFKDGSIIGLNETLLCNYIEWLTNKRMTAIGLSTIYKTSNNPLPWTQKWIAGAEVQVANQETESSQYVLGGIIQDVTNNTFKDVSL